MSDSDWSDGEDEKSPQSADPISPPVPPPSSSSSVPVILFACPVRVFTGSTASPVASGFSILCSPSPGPRASQFTLLLYDFARRPLAAQIFTGAPGEFSLAASEFCEDSEPIGPALHWKPAENFPNRLILAFDNLDDFARAQMILPVVAAASPSSSPSSFLYSASKFPQAKGGKSIKSGTLTRFSLSVSLLDFGVSSFPADFERFCRGLSASGEFSLEAEFPVDGQGLSGFEALAPALGKLRVGHERIIVVSASSTVAQAIFSSRGISSSAALLVVAKAVEALKGAEKKKKKKILAIAPPNEENEKIAEPVTAPPAALEFCASLLDSRSAHSDSLASLPRVQTRLLKLVMKNLYEGLVSDLRLDEENSHPIESEALKETLELRMRGALSEYQSFNSGEQTGTIQNVKNTGEKLTQETERAAVALQQNKRESVDSDELLQSRRALEDFHVECRRLNGRLEVSESSRVSLNQQINAAAAKLKAANEELKKRAELCSVFESGLTEMRAMLEKEIQEKTAARTAFQQLQSLQNRLKLTWVPEENIKNCMNQACRKSLKKSLFGASKVHCRLCGRVFCSSCCKEKVALPELGYDKQEKLKVCQGCWEVKKSPGNPQESEDDEETTDFPQPTRKTAAAQQAKKVSTGFEDLDAAFE